MHKEYFNILVAGFESDSQDTITKLLDTINQHSSNIELRVQTCFEYDDILSALSESFYKICLLNSDLKNKINHKIISEIKNRLNIQNKTTAIININTTAIRPDNTESCCELDKVNINNLICDNTPEVNLINLDCYWLSLVIKSAIERLLQ